MLHEALKGPWLEKGAVQKIKPYTRCLNHDKGKSFDMLEDKPPKYT